MSIIYDALQKTQQKRAQQNNNAQEKLSVAKHWPTKWIVFSIFLLAVSMLFISQVNKSKTKSLRSAAMLSVKTDQENNSIMHTAEAIPHFILNGVFISEQLKVAMINNHPYSLGDKVGYFKVTSISTNRVQLQHDKQRIVLHYDG